MKRTLLRVLLAVVGVVGIVLLSCAVFAFVQVRRFDASSRPLPTPLRASSSTHALGLGETVELARSLDRLPATAIVYGVEGLAFEVGETLSPQVQAVVAGLADEVLREARELAASG